MAITFKLSNIRNFPVCHLKASEIPVQSLQSQSTNIHNFQTEQGNLIKHRAQVLIPSTHLCVGHWGQGAVDAGGGGGHGEQRGDGEGDAGGGGLVVQPEAHPGHAHRHEGRDVDREHVVRQLPRVQ